MTEQEIVKAKKDIDKMSRTDMAQFWRFAPAGHPYFDNTLPLSEYFDKRFKELGGFSPAISKAIESLPNPSC